MTALRALLLLLLFGAALPAAAAPAEPACLDLVVYVREGCPHCSTAKRWLRDLQQRRPELRVRLREIGESAARVDFERLVRAARIVRPGVPTFEACGSVHVGFVSPEVSGTAIEALLGPAPPPAPQGIVLPGIGEVTPQAIGLPLFTLAIGLVDGFNPCAMWVLLFLLGLLVHVRDRVRIALVAGTFVAVSGAVYFAFMAAWLEAFTFVGHSRALQRVLGALALLVGGVHIKDFFALGRGISLSIPAAVKPTLYQRVRAVVRADNLPAALFGAAVLATLVNLVELLCTAGLPALYTQILGSYPLGRAAHYGYLGLYILAYVADDLAMVALAVVTLGRRSLQEREGRWLKLLSGLVIAALGAALLLAPQWLRV